MNYFFFLSVKSLSDIFSLGFGPFRCVLHSFL